MSDKNTSTLQSAVDSVTGAAQSVIGTFTGNQERQSTGADKRDAAAVKDDLSHSAAKIGPYSASATGAITKDDPNRTTGSWNQTVGSGKEMVGNALGYEGLKKEGIEQNREGKGQEAQGQLNDLGSGAKDRFTGAVGGAVHGATGNREEQARFQEKHDSGKTRQRGAETDIQKQG